MEANGGIVAVPTFSGNAQDWAMFKVSMQVYLLQYGIDVSQRDQDGEIKFPRR